MRTNSILLCALLATLGSPLAAAPIARWTFDQTESRRLQDHAGKSHGVIQGESTVSVTSGPTGTGLTTEDGLTYAVIPHREEVNLRNDFAITMLFRPTVVDGYRTLLWKGDRTGKPERIQYLVDLNSGKVEFKAKQESGEWVVWNTRTTCVLPERWVLLRVEFVSGQCCILVNGVECPLIAPKSTGPILRQLVANADPLYFALGQTAAGNPGYGFSGTLAEIEFSLASDQPAANALLPRIARTNIAEFLGQAASLTRSTAAQTRVLAQKWDDISTGIAPGTAANLGAEGALILARLSGLTESLNRADLSRSRLPTSSHGPGTVHRGLPVLLQAMGECLQSLREAEQSIVQRLNDGVALSQPGDPSVLFALEVDLEKELGGARSTLEAWLAKVERLRRESNLFVSAERFAAIPCAQGITLARHREVLSRIPETKGPMQLQLARNEREGLQVLLLPRPGTTGELEVDFSAGPFASANGGPPLPPPELAPMKTVSNRTSEVSVDFRGDIFDVIMPGQHKLVLKDDAPSAVFVRFKTRPDTPAGLYRGTLHFAAARERRAIEVEIVVSDFALPEHSRLRVAFSFSEARYRHWFPQRESADVVQRRIGEFMRAYRLAPNDIYHPDIFPDPSRSPSDNFYTLGYYGPHQDPAPEAVDQEIASLRARWEKARSAGIPAERIYLYSWDEYGTFDKGHFNPATVRRYIDRVKAVLPGLKRMQTSVPRPPFEEWWNVWVPLISDFRRMNPEVVERPGTEVWWYWVGDPRPYPNFFLGYPAHESRMALLLGYKYHLRGCLYWCINREWSDNAAKAKTWPTAEWDGRFSNALTQKSVVQPGLGNLCYPGPDGSIWPSLRLENIRDGIEDFEYLAILERLATQNRSGQPAGTNPRLKEIERLLTIPDEVVASTSRWTKDPAVLADFRSRVAAMIEHEQARR